MNKRFFNNEGSQKYLKLDKIKDYREKKQQPKIKGKKEGIICEKSLKKYELIFKITQDLNRKEMMKNNNEESSIMKVLKSIKKLEKVREIGEKVTGERREKTLQEKK